MSKQQPLYNTGPGVRRIETAAGNSLYLLPEELIELNAELAIHREEHAELLDYVARVVEATGPKAYDDWVMKLSAIAAYLGILMDGTYDAAALNVAAAECTKRLKARRQ